MQPKTFSHSIILSEYFSMDAITFIGAIPNPKTFDSVTHSICIYCVSIRNFNKICFISTLTFFLTEFSLRIGSVILIATFCTIWLDFYRTEFVSFVLQFHEVKTLLKLCRKFHVRVNFNVKLNN